MKASNKLQENFYIRKYETRLKIKRLNQLMLLSCNLRYMNKSYQQEENLFISIVSMMDDVQVIDDIKYFFDDKILYTVIDENYEVNIYDSKENEDFLKNSLISTLNLKELVINLKNEFSYELETITSKNNINYLLMFKNEGNSDYKILFDSNFDILDIEIFYEDSNLINKIFLKQLKVNTKFNESEVKIDLDNYKDYFINRL